MARITPITGPIITNKVTRFTEPSLNGIICKRIIPTFRKNEMHVCFLVN